jgi:hypothetical protein
MRQFFAPILFMLSAGLYFNHEQAKNAFAVGGAGLLALVATYFTLEQLYERVSGFVSGEKGGAADLVVAVGISLVSILGAGATARFSRQTSRPDQYNRLVRDWSATDLSRSSKWSPQSPGHKHWDFELYLKLVVAGIFVLATGGLSLYIFPSVRWLPVDLKEAAVLCLFILAAGATTLSVVGILFGIWEELSIRIHNRNLQIDWSDAIRSSVAAITCIVFAVVAWRLGLLLDNSVGLDRTIVTSLFVAALVSSAISALVLFGFIANIL